MNVVAATVDMAFMFLMGHSIATDMPAYLVVPMCWSVIAAR